MRPKEAAMHGCRGRRLEPGTWYRPGQEPGVGWLVRLGEIGQTGFKLGLAVQLAFSLVCLRCATPPGPRDGDD